MQWKATETNFGKSSSIPATVVPTVRSLGCHPCYRPPQWILGAACLLTSSENSSVVHLVAGSRWSQHPCCTGEQERAFWLWRRRCRIRDMENSPNSEGCSKATGDPWNDEGSPQGPSIYIYFCELSVCLAHSSGPIHLLTVNSALTSPFLTLHPCGLEWTNSRAGHVIQAQTMICDPGGANLV